MHLLQAQFVGEMGIDTGGPTRELFSLVMVEIAEKYLSPTGYVLHNAVALQVSLCLCG